MDAMTMDHSLEVTTPSYREITLKRRFRAPRSRVFDAFTKPELIKRWLLGPDGWSMPVCEVDLRPGGSYRYAWRNDTDGREFGCSGTYSEVVPLRRTVRSERFFDDPSMAGAATVSETFDEENGITTVTLTILHESRELRDAALESGMESGVARSYDRLDSLLDGSLPEV